MRARMREVDQELIRASFIRLWHVRAMAAARRVPVAPARQPDTHADGHVREDAEFVTTEPG